MPGRVFTQAFTNPVNTKPNRCGKNLRQAKLLLEAAGWRVINGKLRKGDEVFRVEFLLAQAAFERIISPYIQNLKKLGIDASIRMVDVTQYQNRVLDYDFDIMVNSFGQSLSPGNEQRNYWGSDSADRQGGRNLIGIKNAAVDQLIEHIIFAEDRAAQIAATRALDRVLLWNFYVVPHWHPLSPAGLLEKAAASRHPSPYAHGFPDIWWHNVP